MQSNGGGGGGGGRARWAGRGGTPGKNEGSGDGDLCDGDLCLREERGEESVEAGAGGGGRLGFAG